MASSFDSERDCPALRRARGAYIASLLDDLLPPMRLAARGLGYAIAVHGSLARDLDLVAIPWVVGQAKPAVLIDRLCGVIAGVAGRAVNAGSLTEKPHGRQALTIITAGDVYIDLSIMPAVDVSPTAPEAPAKRRGGRK